MISLSRLAKVVYLVSLLLALYLLLEPARSQAQFRGSHAIPTFFGINLSGFLPNGGRLIGMPPPPLLPPLNNYLYDTTGSPLALLSGGIAISAGGVGGGVAGGGIVGGQGFGGGIAGGGGGFAGGSGFGGGISGGGFGGGSGIGGLSMMGMGGGMGGMGGFAGKGMGGFNGRKAL